VNLKLYLAIMVLTTTPPTTYGYSDLSRLMSLMTGDEKHSAAATSTLDVIWTLYDRVMRIEPDTVDDPTRDRFLLSKGHGPAAYYAVLAAKGFLDVDTLATFATYESPLGHHPDSSLIPAAEIASGSLGHGLPMGVGLALGLRARRNPARVLVLLGDGELDEGSNHEAIALAGRRSLDNLTAIVIDNQSASQGWPGGIQRRFEVEGWAGRRVNGRDHDALAEALAAHTPGRPSAVVALTEPRQ
jgi:transketolase